MPQLGQRCKDYGARLRIKGAFFDAGAPPTAGAVPAQML